MLNADTAGLKSTAAVAVALADVADPAEPMDTLVRFDDRWLMALGSLGFGIAIPLMTDLYGPYTPAHRMFWVGQLGFIGLALAIWAGNRWLLLKQREHFDWFSHPLRKLLMLVTANVLYTAPITALGLLAWFAGAGLAVDGAALKLVVLANVICVLFVTHAYETLFLIRERESDLVRVERLQRARLQSELSGLKAQVDPHFLFNSLNTLGHLIANDAQRGREFCDALAEVYRYVPASREHDQVALADELAFVRRYHRLLVLRFGDAMQLQLDAALNDAALTHDLRVVPMALQTLIENAVKHNQVGGETPLVVHLQLGADAVTVRNRRLPRLSSLPSSGLGLANLDERCRLVTGRALQVDGLGPDFAVSVPVVRM